MLRRGASLHGATGLDLEGLGLVDEGLVDVGNHTTTGDGRLDEGVQLLVTTNGELQAGRDTNEGVA